jgi:hypothetical protein
MKEGRKEGRLVGKQDNAKWRQKRRRKEEGGVRGRMECGSECVWREELRKVL